MLINKLFRFYSTAIRKRITRIQSDIKITPEEVSEGMKNPSDNLPVKIVNRNPRNLEQLYFEPKPLGWELECTNKSYWNIVLFEKSTKYLSSKLLNHSGNILVTASTSETCINSRIRSTFDKGAAEILAKIFARRCLESGIIYATLESSSIRDNSIKAKVFYENLQKNGLCLREPHQIFPRRKRDL